MKTKIARILKKDIDKCQQILIPYYINFLFAYGF
jgi:hypothetical protein